MKFNNYKTGKKICKMNNIYKIIIIMPSNKKKLKTYLMRKISKKKTISYIKYNINILYNYYFINII